MRLPMHTQHSIDFSRGDMPKDDSLRLLESFKRGRLALEAKLRNGCSSDEFSQLTQLLNAVEAAQAFIESTTV